MGQTTEYDMGVDVDRHWILDNEGDIKLVGESDNLAQAVYNRLTCYLGNLDWCYAEYGSTLKDWLGRNNTSANRKTLEREITKRVRKDIRVEDVTATVVDYSGNYVGVKIDARIVEDNSEFSEYFLFSTDIRNHDTNYNVSYHDTYITSRRYGYFAKPGELLTVHCHVMDKRTGLRVPIGMVSCYIGGYHVDTLMIEQSGSSEPASVTFTFRTPLFLALGEHELIFEYGGIHGFNPCKQSFALYVVDKLPTYITFEDEDVYTAGIGEDPVTVHNRVRDYNGFDAELGVIEFSISDIDATVFRIENPVIYYGGSILDEVVHITTTTTVRDETDRYVFELNRMFHQGQVIKLVSSMDVILDRLLVRRIDEEYQLVHTDDNVTSTTVLRLMS